MKPHYWVDRISGMNFATELISLNIFQRDKWIFEFISTFFTFQHLSHFNIWPPPKEYHPTCQTTYSTNSDLILDGRCIATHVNSRNQRQQVQEGFSWSPATQNAKNRHICSSYLHISCVEDLCSISSFLLKFSMSVSGDEFYGIFI